MALFITKVGEVAGGSRFKYFYVTFRAEHLGRELHRRLAGGILPSGETRWDTWSPGWCHRLKGRDISSLVTVEFNDHRDWAFVRFPDESLVQAMRESAFAIPAGS